jgi:thiol:disulfide interchange protein DsbA
MQQDRRFFLGAIGAAALTAVFPAVAQVAGRDYSLINVPQPAEDPGKIEVLEFFSYGCPHCHEFHPLLSAWAAKLPGDVVLKKVPVSFNGYFAMVAPLYYALEVTGDLERVDSDVFKAIHADGNRLADARARGEWAKKVGVDAIKLEEAIKSFGVATKVKRAEQLTSAYGIRAVPTLAVAGQYLVGGRDFNDALSIADSLIAKTRAERAPKSAGKTSGKNTGKK